MGGHRIRLLTAVGMVILIYVIAAHGIETPKLLLISQQDAPPKVLQTQMISSGAF